MQRNATSAPVQAVPRTACSIDDATQSLGLSRRTVCELVASGRLASFRVGHRRLVPVGELARFIAADTRPAQQEEPNHAR